MAPKIFMEQVEREFRIGQAVQWESQSQGIKKTKSGVVAAVIEARYHPDRNEFKALFARGVPRTRPTRTYVVRSGSKIFWPLVQYLEPVEPDQEVKEIKEELSKPDPVEAVQAPETGHTLAEIQELKDHSKQLAQAMKRGRKRVEALNGLADPVKTKANGEPERAAGSEGESGEIGLLSRDIEWLEVIGADLLKMKARIVKDRLHQKLAEAVPVQRKKDPETTDPMVLVRFVMERMALSYGYEVRDAQVKKMFEDYAESLA